VDGQHDKSPRYLVFLWKPTGYELSERQGELPDVGTELNEGELRLRVYKVGPSPLPADSRPCVFANPIR
jgi:hypothetical protein